MICIYCSGKTVVTNSRPSKRTPGTWRRRQCTQCHAVFTSREHADLSQTHVVTRADSPMEPFSRDTLLISVYQSCRHRKTALEDATALTSTIITKLLHTVGGTGTIPLSALVTATNETLQKFDTTAATYYRAYYN